MGEDDKERLKIAQLAHDLRTPLSAMRLTSELIARDPLTKSQEDNLATLKRAIEALSEMTTDLIEGRASSGSPVAVIGLLRECGAIFQAAADNKNLLLELVFSDDLHQFQAEDGGVLRRVILTLLDNAVKYTPVGTIRLSAGPCDPPVGGDHKPASWLLIKVEDTGPGIDQNEIDQLFQPFARGVTGLKNTPGSGLGLWGCAQKLHGIGGSISYSASEMGGSCFEVRIPANVHGLVFSRSDEDKPTSDQTVVNPSGLPDKVLIVDDNDTNCRLLAALLESFGIVSEVAKSGPEAIGLVRQNDYDAVLLDLHMPGMSGLETASTLRLSKAASDLPIIAVTAAKDSVTDQELKQAGFQDIISKPLAPEALFAKLAQLTDPKPV